MRLVLLSWALILSGSECLESFDLFHCLPDLSDFLVSPTDPWMRQHILQADSLTAILLQQTCDEIFSLGGDELPDLVSEGDGIIDGLPGGLLVVIGIIREHPAEQNIYYDAEAPQVNLLTVRPLQKHLRSHVRLKYKLVWMIDLPKCRRGPLRSHWVLSSLIAQSRQFLGRIRLILRPSGCSQVSGHGELFRSCACSKGRPRFNVRYFERGPL